MTTPGIVISPMGHLSSDLFCNLTFLTWKKSVRRDLPPREIAHRTGLIHTENPMVLSRKITTLGQFPLSILLENVVYNCSSFSENKMSAVIITKRCNVTN